MPETATDTALSPLEFFRLKIASAESPVSRANLQRALDALTAFVGDTDLTFDGFTDSLLGELIVRHLFQGHTPKTIYNNIIKRLATLYNKAVEAGLAQPTEAFRRYAGRLERFQLASDPYTVGSDVFRRLQTLIRTDYSHDLPRQLAKDVLLFSVYCGGLTFEQVAMYRKDDYTGSDPAITEIVGRYSKPRNKYLFPLNQAHLTPRQLSRFVQTLVGGILGSVQLKLSSAPTFTALDLWCAVALSCGVSASAVSACISAAKAPSMVSAFAPASAISEDEITDIRTTLNADLTHNPVRWYVMQLRPRVTADMVLDRLADRQITLAETYYPMEDIARKVGHRKVFQSRPVISWLLFFRARATDLPRLYHEIGDLAWGYRRSRSLNAPYAIISPGEIHAYRTAIGDFGADTTLYPEGAIELQPGDRLLVIGGLFSGRPATLDSLRTEGGRTICRILLDGGHYRDWISDQDLRLLRKITPHEYEQLRTAQ